MRPFRHLNIVNAIAHLQRRGFVSDFCTSENSLFCPQQKVFLRACDFDILEIHYFPRDRFCLHERIIYCIESAAYCIKGILLLNSTGKVNLFPEIIDKKLKEYEFRTRQVFDNGIL